MQGCLLNSNKLWKKELSVFIFPLCFRRKFVYCNTFFSDLKEPNILEENTSNEKEILDTQSHNSNNPDVEEPTKTELLKISRAFYTPFKESQLYSPYDLSFEKNLSYRYSLNNAKEDPWKRLCISPLKRYKSFNVLSEFITEMGRILPRDETGCSAKHQRQLAKAIRRCRGIGLLPTTQRHPTYLETKRKYYMSKKGAIEEA
ncbi:ribosomal protein S18 [Pneumocystis carinii B80]|uniref:Small ribosomal subunit protein bS18m n=1 Tax=Pneumocystis carinii (strain B80) TaxID=1408658 RepID=A0A0W4ZPF7_PNEC8|nr:ribosomal protein S18 [Pneumocystis carinii B80]KTW30250.1 ribosomal protein S18 [Pneumocystis carinii B80]